MNRGSYKVNEPSGTNSDGQDVNLGEGVYGQTQKAPPPSYSDAVERESSGAAIIETNVDDRSTAESEGSDGGAGDGPDHVKILLGDPPNKTGSTLAVDDGIPFADDNVSERSAARADDDERDFEDRSRRAEEALKKNVQDIRRENSQPDKPEEVEMMLVSDNRHDESDDGSTSLRFRGARRESMDVVDAEQISLTMMRPSTEYIPQDDGTVEAGEDQEPEIPDCPHPILTYIVTKWYKMSNTKRLLAVGVLLLLVGVVLLVTLFPASFVYIEYHEYALSRNKWTSAVDYSTVYESGCYLLRPQDEMIRFDATAHYVDMELGVMNKESLSIILELHLQYFLKRDQIVDLFRLYHFGYDSVIKNIIEAKVKNLAISFTMDEYRLSRNSVEASILKELKYVLSGNCCPAYCNRQKNPPSECWLPHCDPDPDTCSVGKHVDVRYFQLGQIKIPEEVLNRYMKTVVQQIDAEKEFSIQDKAITVKTTTLGVQRILNQAKERREEAKAQAYLINTKAEASKESRVQQSYQKALSKLFKELNVTNEETKLSFIYLRALEKSRENLLAFNYDSNTAITP